MARTITEVHKAILDDIAANVNLELTSTSKFARYRQFSYIIAVAIVILEQLFDLFKRDVRIDLVTYKPHTLSYYRDIALKFQYGSALPYGSTEYDNTGKTDQQVADEQIVAYCAVIENNGRLTMKVAQLVNGELASLTTGGHPEKLTAFEAYMEAVKDAGVKITYITDDADHLKLAATIYYDQMVLDATGQRLDGTNNTPVLDAINNYLLKLPFNAEFSKTALIDALQGVEGVGLVNISSCQTKFGANAYALVTERYTPHAGYLKIYDPATELTLTWVPR